MNKKIILAIVSIIGLIVVIAFGLQAYALHIEKPVVDLSSRKDEGNLLDTPNLVKITTSTALTTSTTLMMIEGSPDEEAMNMYWLSRINELRQQKKLEPISFDARLANTAKIWAIHMGTTGTLSHNRPNGEKVSEWIKTYHLPFATRGIGDVYRNTFTENIGRAYADISPKSFDEGLQQVLTSMVDEGPEGDHYRTIFSSNWNRYGGGFYFEPTANGRVRVYMVFHYARLQ